MNIVQLHERVRFWVDIVSSARFESTDIDNAINIAISSKVRESYDQNMPLNKSDSFQRVQRIRDELGPLVKRIDKITAGSTLSNTFEEGKKVINISTYTNYGWLLSIQVKEFIDGDWYPLYPLSLDRKNIISLNPFRRVRTTPQSKYYYYEKNGKFVLEDELTTIYDIEIYYLAVPTIVNYGIEYGSGQSFGANNTYAISIEETVYAGTIYPIGTKFLMTTAKGFTITSGRVVYEFIETELRPTTHEEISRRAAINCLMTSGEFDRAKALREEIIAS